MIYQIFRFIIYIIDGNKFFQKEYILILLLLILKFYERLDYCFFF